MSTDRLSYLMKAYEEMKSVAYVEEEATDFIKYITSPTKAIILLQNDEIYKTVNVTLTVSFNLFKYFFKKIFDF